MIKKAEYDFTHDRHIRVGYSSDIVYAEFSTGDVVRLSWDVVKALIELAKDDEDDKKED